MFLSLLAPVGAQAAVAVPAGRFVDAVGVNVHMMHTDQPYWQLGQTRAALRYLKVRHVRDGVRFYRKRSQAWYMREQAVRLGALAADGLKLDALLGGPYNEAGSSQQLLQLVEGLPSVDAVEATNEWDLNGTPIVWPLELRNHVRRIRQFLDDNRALRDLPLIGPGLGRRASAQWLGDLSGVVDFGNGHPYPGGLQPELPEYDWQENITLLKGIDAIKLVSGPRPIMMTETGYHNALNQQNGQLAVDEDTAAIYTTRILLEFFRLGLPRTYLYELVDAGGDPELRDQEAHFGLFRSDWTPKPAATAVRNLLAQFRDPGGLRTQRYLDVGIETEQDETMRSMVFAKADGSFIVAMWRVQPVWDAERRVPRPIVDVPTRVRLGRSFAVAKVFRPTRSPAPLAVSRDVREVTAPLGPEPTLVKLEPGPNLPTAEEVGEAIREGFCRQTKLCRSR